MGSLVAQSALGIFEGQTDIGSVTPAGTAAYDAAAGTYTIAAAGADLWDASDNFHFVWKKVSGDVALTADVTFPDTAGTHYPRRKAMLMVRQGLDTDSPYVAVTQHGVGATVLQYRRVKGGGTQDIEVSVAAPKRIRLVRRGDAVTMFLSANGEPLHQVGASMKVRLWDSFYVGLGVCSHDAKVTEKAVFSNVKLETSVVYSTLQTMAIDPAFLQAKVVYTTEGRMEAPNWTRDGQSLIFNQNGKMMMVPVKGGEPKVIDVGAAVRCGGSHGLSPDGKELAITCAMLDKPETRVYAVPMSGATPGGTPRMVTEHGSSYWHSWSPDGRTIAFTRPAHGSGDIFVIPAAGGEEKQITSGEKLSDDPDYSPDGKYIYFNSDRSGGMQIWRMKTDGSVPEQITFDEMVNWTPHVSPDGKWMVFQSYPAGTTGHPTNTDIAVRIMSLEDRKVRTLANVVGGTGMMNVPSWAPDSKHLAFMTYLLMLPEETGSIR
ncbi:hypothetical protein FTO74_13105 [Granulicella sp. WH15]|uniref:PD40 domain-containing protein n=1 Tax=Granulicella sp. WH15 TaxID=2602070 RepID=UPI001366FBA8|nr:PD40 domain-containing protein [Granulicella sp. WH15]QHN04197.1 hypothetical protein FTO74_13105 [Granulicella sp. WH15]